MFTQFLATMPPPARRFAAAVGARRGRLILFVGAVATAAVIVSLLLPNWYAAESTILPPVEGSESMGLMSGLIENAALSRLGLTATQTPSDVYAEILKSRTLRESLAVAYDLGHVYKMRNMDYTLKELGEHSKVEVKPSGVVILRIEDRDRKRAADMTNYLVDGLDRFNREGVNTRGKRTRQFLEKRVADIHERMQQADSALSAYERKHKVIASSEAASIEGAASVIARKLDLQVQKSYVGSYSRSGSPALRVIDAELSALDGEIAKLPGLKEEGAQLALDAEIQRRIFTLLTAQYEDARVQETRDTPTLTVLDRARPPDLKSRPRRSILVLAATGAAMLMAAGWIALSLREPQPA